MASVAAAHRCGGRARARLIYLGIPISTGSRVTSCVGAWRDGSRLRAVGRDEKCRHFIYRDLISAAVPLCAALAALLRRCGGDGCGGRNHGRLWRCVMLRCLSASSATLSTILRSLGIDSCPRHIHDLLLTRVSRSSFCPSQWCGLRPSVFRRHRSQTKNHTTLFHQTDSTETEREKKNLTM